MIPLKTKEEILIMKEGGQKLAKILKALKESVKPGIKTKDLEELAQKLILKEGAICSFKGYKDPESTFLPYPACLCTSVNEEIVHVPPSNRVLKEGDVLKLDLGIFYKGFHSDAAITVAVGKVSFEAQRLIRVTKKALKLAIKKARPGNTFGDISNIIQRYVESQGFNVIRELCGHGIGRELHEEPQILNYGKRKTGEKIREGMVFCIEPMVSIGDWHLVRTKDGFGYKTKDNSLTAHFEHTIAITKRGAIVLTALDKSF
jgi:methionyl aminopeptidase